MFFIKLIARNALRHRLRTLLTLLGIVVAIVAFGLLSTVVDAWYAGAEGASATRLVTRNATSLAFFLPISYKQKIRGVEGVRAVSHATWFAGIYREPKNFFPQFAVDAATYLGLYKEYLLSADQKMAFLRDRQGCVIGRKVADVYGFKVGDVVPLKGTIFPGNWEFVVRGIYDGVSKSTDVSQMFFHWDYLNEVMRRTAPRRVDLTGVFVVDVTKPDEVAAVSLKIDQTFKNSLAETITETEKAFQLSFVSMTEALVIAIRTVSYVVIFIIMAVMANTMAMTARERLAEYATFKAMGFGPSFLMVLIFGESLMIVLLGAAIGIALTYPIADQFGQAMGTLFKSFRVSQSTVWLQLGCAVVVGIVASMFPMYRVTKSSIVEGLRNIG